MFYNSYEDFSNSLDYGNFNTYPMYYDYNNNRNVDFDSFYPDIYRRLNPIVKRCCMKYQNTRITGEIVDEITQNVFNQYNDSRGNDTQEKTNSNMIRKDETRSNGNFLLDLIKILVVKNLISNCNNCNRPPIRPMPGYRPGFDNQYFPGYGPGFQNQYSYNGL